MESSQPLLYAFPRFLCQPMDAQAQLQFSHTFPVDHTPRHTECLLLEIIHRENEPAAALREINISPVPVVNVGVRGNNAEVKKN